MSNKQTSIEWLFNKLWEISKDKLTWHSVLEQAKEMHKSELERNYFIGLLHPKEIKDPAEVIEEKIGDLEIINEAIEHSNLYTNKFTPRNAFIEGVKWYREQLKQRQ
jgi:hypothetical protein